MLTKKSNEMMAHTYAHLYGISTTGYKEAARQKRISIDNEHDRIDLVFYLNYYKNEISMQGDNPPIGIILCTEKNNVKVEYATAGLDENLFVSKYKIALPTTKELEELVKEDLEELI